MALESRGFSIGIISAAADLSAKQFTMVKPSGAFGCVSCSVIGEPSMGILQNKPKSGEPADITAMGISKLVCGTGGLTSATQYETAADGTGVLAEVGKVGLGYVISGGAVGELATVTIGLPCGAVIHA